MPGNSFGIQAIHLPIGIREVTFGDNSRRPSGRIPQALPEVSPILCLLYGLPSGDVFVTTQPVHSSGAGRMSGCVRGFLGPRAYGDWC